MGHRGPRGGAVTAAGVTERFGPIDFDQFHLVDLPARLIPGGDGLRPLAFRVDGRAYTFRAGVEIVEGDDGAHTVVELSHDDWNDFVWELRTGVALFYAERATFRRGHFGHLAAWEPTLRALFDGQAIYDLDSPPPVEAIDLTASFDFGADDREIKAFLDTAGFVHLRGVVSADEVEALRHDVEAGVAGARPDDRRSWWTTVDGVEVCSRVNYLNEQFPRIAALGSDPRMRRIASFGGPDLVECPDRLDGRGVVIKVPGATTGLADLPWHRDCGMGGHPVKCPMLNVGVQLDAATAGSGQLQMIAGSHRGTSRLPTPAQEAGLPVVALDTEPGDVTVHFGHILHAAPPPTDRGAAGRRALYFSFVPPSIFSMVGPGQGYNDVLFTRDAGHVHHVDEFQS